MKKIVLVTRTIPHINLLNSRKELEIFMGQARPPTEEELSIGVKGVDGILSLLTEKITADLMDKAGNRLKVIANYAVGYDNIDVKAATKKGIIVTNTPYTTEPVAEHALALIAAITKHVIPADRFVRDGEYKYWDPMIFHSKTLSDCTLGVVGAGRIGTHLIEISGNLFGKILYTDVHENKEIESKFGAKKVGLEELLRQSDVVSLHTVLNEQTKHMIGREQIQIMKPSSYLINASRGAVVDEEALIDALESKKIAGAALDVFENEPKVPDRLKKLDNVVLTPHIASATERARKEMSEAAAQSIIDALIDGKMPESIVNKDVVGKSRLERG